MLHLLYLYFIVGITLLISIWIINSIILIKQYETYKMKIPAYTWTFLSFDEFQERKYTTTDSTIVLFIVIILFYPILVISQSLYYWQMLFKSSIDSKSTLEKFARYLDRRKNPENYI